jgi:phage FluMu gp28-like protein
MLFQKDKTVLCIATKQETAKGMVEKVQFMYNNLPSWLKGNQKPVSDNKLSLKLANNSQIVATSAASDAGRSYAVSLLLVDEAAFIEGIDKIYTSIKPTIATGGGIIALSSPNGVGNWFNKMYAEA